VALFSKFFGRTVGEGAGVAIGTATANVVEPALQELANAAKEQYPHYPLRPEDAAAARAREPVGDLPGLPLGGVDPSHEALYGGLQQGRFDVLTELQREHPSVGELLDLRRRNLALGAGHGIEQAEFQEWLRRTGYSAEIIAALTKLLTHFLAPADIANAVQQGFVPDDGILPAADLSGPPFNIPTEQVPLDPSNEAAVSGIDRDRLKVLAELSGNPPGPETLTALLNRGLIDQAQWLHGIREGRTKTKWAGPLLALRRQILSGAQAATLRLKGWITAQESYDIGALSGYSQEQMDRLYLAQGRPAAPVQMFTGWARGIDGPDGTPMDQAQFEKGIRESDIRPEWGPMLWGIRHAYPSLFQLRRAVQDGGISRDRALVILRYERYEDADALALVNSWLRGSGTTKKGLTATDLANEYEAAWITRPQYVAGLKELGYDDATAAAKADAEDAKRVRLARNQLVARIHSQYVAHRISLATATNALNTAGVPARVRDSLLPGWTAERDLTADALTAAQIKKAWQKVMMTRAEAISRLEFKGYDAADAALYLDE
jgi:hypothetical protein